MTYSKSTSKKGEILDRANGRSNGGQAEAPFSVPAFFGDWMRFAQSTPLSPTQYKQPSGDQIFLIPSTLSAALVKGMSDLGRAADPVAFFAAYNEVVSHQLDECVKPIASAMEQLFDMQMLWFHWLEEMASLPSLQEGTNQRQKDVARASWLNAQDEWLAMSQRWIDRSVGNSKAAQPAG